MDPRGEPATIEEAYNELSKTAFAAWIRLQMATPNQLLGRRKIAATINYSPSQSDVILRELKYKGYVVLVPRGHGRASRLVIYRRAVLSGPSSFVRLSNFTFPVFAEKHGINIAPESKSSCNNSNKNPDLCSECKDRAKCSRNFDYSSNKGPYRTALLNPPKKELVLENFDNSSESLEDSEKECDENPAKGEDWEKPNSLIGRKTTHGITGLKVPRTRVKMVNAQIEDADEQPDRNTETHHKKAGPSISLNKFKSIRNKNKAERSKRNKKKTKPKVPANFSRSKVNWDKLDQRGNPAISFSPSNKKRKKMIEILDQPRTNPVRRSIMEKMASEFGRIYSRYRRMLQKQKGNVPTYLLPPQERKYAGLAAEWCIRKNVTPKQVLAYWHMNIGNFAEKKMDIPPLVFLSSPANIDTVACASLDDLEIETKQSKDKGHGFSDEYELDTRLRPALEKAGFETVLYNNRHLLTIQKTAQSIAKGVRLFVGAEMKPMVDWAAKHLYRSKER